MIERYAEWKGDLDAHVHATRIFDDPPVIFIKRWSLFMEGDARIGEAPLAPLVSMLAHQDVVWLVPSPWVSEDDWTGPDLLRTARLVQETAPRHRVIFVANTDGEFVHLRRLGLESFVANQNQFVDRDLFTPAHPPLGKTFDAVYNARFLAFKRHHLAAAISRLVLIGYDLDSPDARLIREQLPAARIANTGTAWLSPTDVNAVLNQSACRLCLSAEEGAMSAAVEYLLAGLPVVTTANRGGRDYFMDGRFARWVDSTPAAVAREVRHLVAEQIDPAFIRQETLRKLDRANDAFLDSVASRVGIDRRALEATYRRRFNHRLASAKPVRHLVEPDVAHVQL